MAEGPLNSVLTNAYWQEQGLISLAHRYAEIRQQWRTALCGPAARWRERTGARRPLLLDSWASNGVERVSHMVSTRVIKDLIVSVVSFQTPIESVRWRDQNRPKNPRVQIEMKQVRTEWSSA